MKIRSIGVSFLLAVFCVVGVGPIRLVADEVAPSQLQYVKKYAKQDNVPEPGSMEVNLDEEPDLDEGFTELLAGKGLADWTPKGGTCDFAMDGDVLVAKCDPGSPSTYLCTNKSDYKNFVFTCEMRWDVDGNTGVMFRASAKTDKNDSVTVFGPQAEMEALGTGRYWSGGIYGQSCGGWYYPLWLTSHEAARGAIKPDDWNRLTIQAIGNSVKTWVNGVPAANWTNEQYTEGFFGIQVHKGKAGQTQWRNVRVKELP